LFENGDGSVLAAGKDYISQGNVRHGGDSYIRTLKLSIGGERRMLEGDKEGNLVGCTKDGYEAVGSVMQIMKDDLWHRLTVVGENKLQSYYVDGKFIGDIERQGTGKLCVIGGQNGKSWWGKLAQFQLFKVALSAEQIVSLPNHSHLGEPVAPTTEILPEAAIQIDFHDGKAICLQDTYNGEPLYITHLGGAKCPVIGPDDTYSEVDTVNGRTGVYYYVYPSISKNKNYRINLTQ